MAGLPIAGIGTLFYFVLLLGMGAAKLWRWGLGVIRRIGDGLRPGTRAEASPGPARTGLQVSENS